MPKGTSFDVRNFAAMGIPDPDDADDDPQTAPEAPFRYAASIHTLWGALPAVLSSGLFGFEGPRRSSPIASTSTVTALLLHGGGGECESEVVAWLHQPRRAPAPELRRQQHGGRRRPGRDTHSRLVRCAFESVPHRQTTHDSATERDALLCGAGCRVVAPAAGRFSPPAALPVCGAGMLEKWSAPRCCAAAPLKRSAAFGRAIRGGAAAAVATPRGSAAAACTKSPSSSEA